MVKHEYPEGSQVQERLDNMGIKVFRAPKSSAKSAPKKQPIRKAKSTSKV